MPKFSQKSKNNLESCHDDLQKLFNEVIKYFDCSIICGYRGERDQNEAFFNGNSKVMFPNSMHNLYPSLAVDVVPYRLDWEDIDRFYYFSGFVLGIAKTMNIPIRWGGDWDSDTEVNDNKFNDLVHFELVLNA